MAAYTERIDAELEELIPLFLENTRKELDAMKASLDSEDFETLRRLGHSTKGAAFGYGFEGMGNIGLQIEDAAKAGSTSQAKVLVEELANYIDSVEIVYE
jgi:HPt (histidine-containing phosphotransfer) domain-containing protein